MKKILFGLLAIFLITGCGAKQEENKYEEPTPNNYSTIILEEYSSMIYNRTGYIVMNEKQIKCSSSDLEVIEVGYDYFDVELTYNTISEDEYELIDYKFIKADGSVIVTKDLSELKDLILKEIGYPGDGIYEGDFTITKVDESEHYRSEAVGDEEPYTYSYLNINAINADGKEIEFMAKNDETVNYINVMNLKVGEKVHFTYRTERDDTFESFGVNYIIINF